MFIFKLLFFRCFDVANLQHKTNVPNFCNYFFLTFFILKTTKNVLTPYFIEVNTFLIIL
jgi:hypothetical protein